MSSSSSSAASSSSSSEAAVAAAALLWERAWSLEEVRAGSQGWSLAADAGLLRFLQEFSQQTISRTHEIKKQLDRLIQEAKSTDCRLHNVFNGFLMLSNTQFIENRVYDEEVEEPTPRSDMGDKPEQEKSREQKEADLIPKIQEAVNYGLQVLDSAFEQLDVKAGNSDSEEETNERVELILEPKDLYIDRPLPYLIGSQLFMEQDDVGLGDLSSEEGSVDSDRGSMIDSEGKDEEELEEEFGNISEDDQKPRTALVSDEEDDDLFGDSERGEEEDDDLEESAKPKKKRPISFTDELTARIKGEVLGKQEEEHLYTHKKKTVKDNEELSVPSDDDEDIFKPPKLTDEDFSPFGSKGGLFSGGLGLFDDDEESDLFAELPKEGATEKAARVPINDEPSTKAVKKLPAGAVSLFPGGNDVFSPSSLLVEKEDKKLTDPTTNKPPKLHAPVDLFDDDLESNKEGSISAKSAPDLFDDEGDLFKKKTEVVKVANNGAKETEGNKELLSQSKSEPPSAEPFKPSIETPSKRHKSLFSDEEDSEQDLFSSNQSIKSKHSPVSPSKVSTKATLSLFEDEDEEELFGSAPAAKIQVSKLSEEKAASLFFSSDEEDHWNVTKNVVKPSSESSQKRESVKSAHTVSHSVKKRDLFEEQERKEDLFTVTKDSEKKPLKAALLFEEEAENGDSLFGFQPSHLVPSSKTTTADFLEAPQTEAGEDQPGPSGEPGVLLPTPQPEGDGAGEQQRKEKSPLEKDSKRKMKSVFSLFEDEEKTEDRDTNKNTRKEIGKPPENSAKSTGVFQDEELLFSQKLQKDNDPEVDLFAGTKKGVPKPWAKHSPGGGLFGVDEDEGCDSLFGSAKAKPLVPEKKTTVKRGTLSSSVEEDSRVLDCDRNVSQDRSSNLEASEKSSGPAASKRKEPSSRIGKLQAHLDINPFALLPSETTTISNVKPPSPSQEPSPAELPSVQHTKTGAAARHSKELGVSFEYPMQAETLHSANKGRVKLSGKRRPPTRTARRRQAAQDSGSGDLSIAEESSLPLLKESPAPPPTLCPSHPVDKKELRRKRNAEKTQLLPSANSHDYLRETDGGCVSKSAILFDTDDLFEPNDLFAKSEVSKVALRPEAKADMGTPASNIPQCAEKLSVPLEQGGSNHEDLFQPGKLSNKPSPGSFLEDQENLFTNKKTGRKKDRKSITPSDVDPTIHDIFEDDIFASEAIKPLVKVKELDANLFDDDVDIFADLAVKPKERGAKKKMEAAKSIFDEDTDDIFSPSCQSKQSTKKVQSVQTASGTKREFKASNTFEDPLNAFEDQ